MNGYEKAAAAMYNEDDSYDETWESEHDDIQGWYRRMTRPAIEAFLEEEGTPMVLCRIHKCPPDGVARQLNLPPRCKHYGLEAEEQCSFDAVLVVKP